MTNHTTTVKLIRLALKSALLMAALYLGFRLVLLVFVLTSPFVVSAALALAYEPPMKFLERRLALKRSTAALVMVTVTAAVFAVIVFAIVTSIAAELAHLVEGLPHFQMLLREQGAVFALALESILAFLPSQVLSNLNGTAEALLARISELIPDIILAAFGLAALLPQALFFTLIVIVATFFISRDLDLWRTRVAGILPGGSIEPGLKIVARLMGALVGWVKTQLIIMSVNAMVVIIGLSLLDTGYVVLIGVIVGIFDVLPILGPGTILVPWAAYALLTRDFLLGIGLLGIFALTALIRNALTPVVLSENIGIEPLAILAAMYAGLIAWGALGLIVGPIMLVIYVALSEIGLVEKAKQWLLR
jgi:sporulation integral membrane protein YtvI